MQPKQYLSALATAAILLPSIGNAAEHWQAASITAQAITGDVTFSPDAVTFASGPSLPLASMGKLDNFSYDGHKVDAMLYRVTTPGDPVLVNASHLCGKEGHYEPVTFIATWRDEPLNPGDEPRIMAVFSGTEAPKDFDDMHSCGSYNYIVAK